MFHPAVTTVMSIALLSDITIGVASYGALGHVPLLDFQLVIILEIRKMYKNNAIFAHFFINFWPIFVIFLPTVFLRE